MQIAWTGVKYAVTNQVDVIAAYYHYNQNSFFGTAAGAAPCSGAEHSQCAGTFERDLRRHRLEVCTEVGCLPRRHALAIQWRIGERLSENNNVATTAGLRWLLKRREPPPDRPTFRVNSGDTHLRCFWEPNGGGRQSGYANRMRVECRLGGHVGRSHLSCVGARIALGPGRIQ